MKPSTVLGQVVSRNLCIGCGMCASICPKNLLSIDWTEQDNYQAKANGVNCSKPCGLCERVCPFIDGNPNENELAGGLYSGEPNTNHIDGLGFFQSCYAGYSLRNEQRINGASGGMATWLMTEMLRKDIVDNVICVSPHPGPKPLFNFTVCNTPEQVENAAKSAYYPVHMGDVMKQLQSVDGRYAVSCLPCFAKALRLASRAIPKIAQRLVCTIGLVCGHSVSACFAEYTAALINENNGLPSRVTFRAKNPCYPASEHGAVCAWDTQNRTETATVYWSQGLGEAWSRHWFTNNPCLFCDDVFAETADVALMDAWLPEFTPDYRGTSLIVVRSALVDKILKDGLESSDIELTPYSPEQVILSQQYVLQYKREGLAHRLWLAKKRGIPAPLKRVAARKAKSPASAALWSAQMASSNTGPHVWKTRRDLRSFQRHMRRIYTLPKAVSVIYGFCRIPFKILSLAKRKLEKCR